MTSDAKVGLILGLVFIFIIAFIINGLPHLNRSANSNELTTVTSPRNENLDIAANQRSRAGGNLTPAYITTPQSVQAQNTYTPVIETPAPQITQVQYQNIETGNTAPETRFEIALPQSQTPQTPTAVDQIPAVQEKVNNKTLSKIYTVRSGDTLSKIAALCYGSEGGNSYANIDKIKEANNLKSRDVIYEGMKLTIPSLQQEKPNNIFQAPIFEKVKSIAPAITQKIKAEKPQTRQIIVKDGDSLWKIAATHLGNGNRYNEILKLNSLSDEDTLTAGSKLILPEK